METSPNIYNAVHLNDRGKFLVDIVVGKHSRANNIKAGVSRLRVIVEVTQLEPLSDGTIERERRIEINTITVDRQLMALNTNLGAVGGAGWDYRRVRGAETGMNGEARVIQR